MQKHNNISTSTDFLPTTICTDCNSLEHPGSNAYVDSAQPRNTGALKNNDIKLLYGIWHN